MSRCKAVEDEQLRVQIADAGVQNDVGKDRKHLIGVQHPFLLLQTVYLVEPLNLLGDALRALHDRLHLVHRRFRLHYLLQALYAVFIGDSHAVYVISDLYVFDYVVLGTRVAHLANIGLQCAFVEAELILYCEFLRAIALYLRSDAVEAQLLLFKVGGEAVDD